MKLLEYPLIEEKINTGDDPFETLVLQQSTLSANKLYYRDDVRGM